VGDRYLQDHPSLLKEVNDRLVVGGLTVNHVWAHGKRTADVSQEILGQFDIEDVDCVISMGGGRAIDTGKLVAQNHPHIAIPTTAGTGAAMNGVIFGGESAHQETQQTSLLPTLVLGDPSFIDEMDRDDFAARAIGVLMLLSESYVSPKASALSDALVWSGLEAFARGFVSGVDGETEGRDDVFYASLMAGVGSGQAGFGLTHRLGAALEQKSNLTYAQASATVCAETSDVQIQMLSERLPDSLAIDKYAMIGELIAARPFEDREEAYASLVGTLRRWVARLELPKLPLDEKELDDLCAGITSHHTDETVPIRLSQADLIAPLLRRCANT